MLNISIFFHAIVRRKRQTRRCFEVWTHALSLLPVVRNEERIENESLKRFYFLLFIYFCIALDGITSSVRLCVNHIRTLY